MKVKRVTLVAVASMAGPVVLAAAPALADEVRPSPPVSAQDAHAEPAPAPAVPDPAPAPAVPDPAPAPAPSDPVPEPGPSDGPPPGGSAGGGALAPSEGGAPTGDPSVRAVDGLSVQLEGVPGSFVAGGGWGEFSVAVENTSGQRQPGRTILFSLNVLTETGRFTHEIVRAQFFADGAWRDIPLVSDPELGDIDGALPGDFLDFPAGRSVIPVRMAFASDAPLITFYATSTVEGAQAVPGWSESVIVAPDGGGDPGGGDPGGEEPGGEVPGGEGPGAEEPGGGEQGGGTPGPGIDPDPGPTVAPGGSEASDDGSRAPEDGGPAATGRPGGRLAETGTDAVTSWTLGVGGSAVLLGAALLAGTGRHRRRIRP
ncbi:hypothetical protein Sxan_29830 [Streptomyces xanthophaeus]|uniref:LPXTG cell wall anchor domain-containing protein n=1 Tax=Streptomyces xanthophaeus TaxID=67385 RepID=A0A919GX86_9ACTN|nr:hypothetical protein Sxan_29830 [Streptomyces xanthophaeus]